jgi:tetratricopeptide (TPR) repeat protein
MWEQLIARQFQGTQRGQVEIYLANSWRSDPYSRAVAAYTVGNFPVALAGYDTTITEIEKYNKEHPGKAKERNKQDAQAANTVASLHAERGRMFYISGNFDSAYAELVKAQGGKEVADEKRVVRVYESKAILDQSIGLAFERMHMPDSAREAYGRALLEDLAYAPAHLSLASLALADGDTTVALSELEAAAQMSPNDPATAFFYGRALIAAAKDKEGLEQLKRCATLDPYFAAPHMLLGMIYESSDYKEEAAAEFKTFLSLAAANDPYRENVKEKLTTLASGKP